MDRLYASAVVVSVFALGGCARILCGNEGCRPEFAQPVQVVIDKVDNDECHILRTSGPSCRRDDYRRVLEQDRSGAARGETRPADCAAVTSEDLTRPQACEIGDELLAPSREAEG